MLELNDGGDCVTAHVFNGVLIAEPIRSFDGVIHVPLPAILAEIAKARGNPPLSSDGVTAGRKYFGDTCGLQTRLDGALRGT